LSKKKINYSVHVQTRISGETYETLKTDEEFKTLNQYVRKLCDEKAEKLKEKEN